MINIKIKDGSVQQVQEGATVLDVAKNISDGLARNAIAGKIDGKMVQLSEPVKNNQTVEIVTLKDKEGMEVFRHSTAHILALAVKRLFPNVKISIGPAIQDGFYYDFDFENPIKQEDLNKIEAEMQKIIKEGLKFKRQEVKKEEAYKLFSDMNEIYKLELLEAIPDGEIITTYTLGELIDLCRGPHLEDISIIKALKLQSITGAYWRGDEKNKMLTRIYGTSFPKKSELDAYLEMLEQAKLRDHRKIGKEQELFFISPYAQGMPFFMPKGLNVINNLIDYWREIHRKAGYVEISTPIAMSKSLWEKSGHWAHYRDNMYTFQIKDDEEFAIKPMNCPGGMLYYKENIHSYRDLPLRVGELGKVHRHEASGTLHGLFRVRCFTQDDAHIFMTPEQIEDEVMGVLALVDKVYSTFGLKYHIELSTMPDDHMGELKDWEHAETCLKNALERRNIAYQINAGDGAFYGPKLDIHIQDAIGRTWQCGTIQLDMQLPKRFELEYIDENGDRKEPIMLHRVIYGSIERFFGILTEHFAGAFPVWLAPVQVKVMALTDRNSEYVKEIAEKLEANGVRVEVDLRNEKIGYKIREAQLQKIPYMIVVGDNEQQQNIIAVRHRKNGDMGTMTLDEFYNSLKKEIFEKMIK